ncbi:MAG: DUF4349 domain-containing protein [Candidatus Hydrothermarchaeaceae archaeon]
MKTSIFLAALLLTAVFSGCLGATKNAGEAYYPAPDASVAMSEGRAGGFQENLDEKAYAPATATSSPMERKIIKTARLNIEVQDFEAAAGEVERLAQASEGFVSNSNSYVTDTGHRRGTVTIRVPAEGFLNAVEEIKKLGKVKSTSSSGQDMTEEYIDLDARLRTLEKQEGRLLEILENASTVEDLLKVEEHLGRVRGEIERITGRLRYLDNMVDLSTITVDMFEPEPITHSWGFRESISSSVKGFIGTTNFLIVFAGNVMPAVILLVLLFGVYGWRRRGKGK